MPMAMSAVARTTVDAASLIPSVRTVVHEEWPTLPLGTVTTLVDQLSSQFGRERTLATVYSLFGALALLLASIGLFGLMSYAVAARTAEIGIRMALGAQRMSIVLAVVRESMSVVLIGVAIGVLGALAATRLVTALLFGVRAADPWALGAAAAVVMAVAGLAAYLPARKASRVDPVIALRRT
jgi:ABC-type antimicrobial peptide transport system permease subunit